MKKGSAKGVMMIIVFVFMGITGYVMDRENLCLRILPTYIYDVFYYSLSVIIILIGAVIIGRVDVVELEDDWRGG